jgi:predicted small integral membrane protein
MVRLPPPTSFAEGQRALYGWLMSAAGVFCGIVAVVMVGLLMWGNWNPAHERLILIILGCSLGGFITLMGAVIIALAVGGPVGKFTVKAGKDGAELGAEGDASK